MTKASLIITSTDSLDARMASDAILRCTDRRVGEDGLAAFRRIEARLAALEDAPVWQVFRTVSPVENMAIDLAPWSDTDNEWERLRPEDIAEVFDRLYKAERRAATLEQAAVVTERDPRARRDELEAALVALVPAAREFYSYWKEQAHDGPAAAVLISHAQPDWNSMSEALSKGMAALPVDLDAASQKGATSPDKRNER